MTKIILTYNCDVDGDDLFEQIKAHRASAPTNYQAEIIGLIACNCCGLEKEVVEEAESEEGED